ncbi:protein of unknown function [Xenorhabdus poinarii G6]|uniref:Uncharacterized protein n=1 Tax=Xenorhabdus poinarii G6 TaxID=1354304 RepID=A0A068R5Y4_9GAMM|nr:protein of unknown function [Xenorhabdus poinarii G6]
MKIMLKFNRLNELQSININVIATYFTLHIYKVIFYCLPCKIVFSLYFKILVHIGVISTINYKIYMEVEKQINNHFIVFHHLIEIKNNFKKLT